MKDLMKMTEEQIRERFKTNSISLIRVQKEAIKVSETTLVETFMKKYIKCPKCNSPIDKFEGYK